MEGCGVAASPWAMGVGELGSIDLLVYLGNGQLANSPSARQRTLTRQTYENLVLLHSSVPHSPSGIIVPTISTIIHGRFT